MKTELLEQEKNNVKIKVEFEAEEFTESLNETLREIAQKASVPGFRKGRIPRKVLEMRFGKEGLYSEALEKMLPNAIKQVVDDYDLDAIAAPSLNVENIHEGEPLVCELTFEVLPEILLPELEDIEVEKLRPKVTDELVEEMVQEFRKQHATLTPIERPAGEDDVLSVTFSTQVLGSEGSESTSSEESKPTDMDLGAAAIRKEIRDVLLGKTKGDKAETEFDVEPDYQDRSVAGKRIHYNMKVEEVKEKVLPEMTPEFYKKVLNMEVDSEEAFKAEMRKRLTEHQERENANHAREMAIEAIATRSEMEVPETLLARQMEHLRTRDAAEAKRRFNAEMEEVLRNSSISLAEYEQGLREQAQAIVRRTLTLDEVGKKFNVEVSKEEMEAEITHMAETYGVEPAKLRATFFKNRDRMEKMVDDLRYTKIADRIMEKVQIKDVDELTPVASASSEQKAESATKNEE